MKGHHAIFIGFGIAAAITVVIVMSSVYSYQLRSDKDTYCSNWNASLEQRSQLFQDTMENVKDSVSNGIMSPEEGQNQINQMYAPLQEDANNYDRECYYNQ